MRSSDRGALFDKSGNAKPNALYEQNTEAGFTADVIRILATNPARTDEVAEILLVENLPATDHPKILKRIGLRLSPPN